MKRLLILLTALVLMSAPIMAQTRNEAFGTANTATAVFASPAPVSNAAAPVLAITFVIVLAAVYVLRNGIQRRIRTLRANLTGSQAAADPLAILELIQTLLRIIFPAVTAVLLTLHLSGVIPYISAAEKIAGILLSTGIAVCEILDGFLKKKQTA